MLKGCQRETILLQTRDSALFECAWFVLRREKPAVTEADMLAEAERIVREGARAEKRRFGGRNWGKWCVFLSGVLCGAVIFAMIWLFLAI